MRFLLLFSILHFSIIAFSNIGEVDTSESQINQVDEQGRKQGKWIFLGKDQPEKGYPLEGKIAEGIYEDDRKNGEWTIYYKDGLTPRVIGEFRNNRPNGTFKKYHPNGNLKEVGTFNGNRYVDTLKRFNIDGTLVYQAKFNEQGQETGVVKYFHDNGIPEFVFTAKNGIPVGEAKRYWNNGDLKEGISFSENGEVLTSSGIIEAVHPLVEQDDSNLKTAPKVKRKDDSFSSNGYNTLYNKNQELWMEGEFKEDKLWDGRLFIYDENGLLLKVEVYKNGVYHSDGQL